MPIFTVPKGIDPDAEAKKLTDVTSKYYVKVLTAVHEGMKAAVPALSSWELEDKAITAMIRASKVGAVRMTDATLESIREQLAVAEERGYSIDQIAHGVPTDGYPGIDGLYDEHWKYRSETIARSELGTAALKACADRYRESGVVGEQEILDGDFDAECAARNETRVPVDEDVELNHPNCVVSVAPVLLPEAEWTIPEEDLAPEDMSADVEPASPPASAPTAPTEPPEMHGPAPVSEPGVHSPELQTALDDTEERLRYMPAERAYALDQDGKLLARGYGDADISAFGTDVPKISGKDAVLTHNHLEDFGHERGLTTSDLLFADELNLAEIRAVTPWHTWELARPTVGWDEFINTRRSMLRDIRSDVMAGEDITPDWWVGRFDPKNEGQLERLGTRLAAEATGTFYREITTPLFYEAETAAEYRISAAADAAIAAAEAEIAAAATAVAAEAEDRPASKPAERPAGEGFQFTIDPSDLARIEENVQARIDREVRDFQRDGRTAEERATTEASVRAEVTAQLHKWIDHSGISVRRGGRGSAGLLKDGRMRTQFETNRSSGSLDHQARAEAENRGLGVPMKVDKKDRPVYGYINAPDTHDGASQYGAVEWQLSDLVRERATFTYGDSLGKMCSRYLGGSPVNHPEQIQGWDESINQIRFGTVPYSYLEVQIQRGVHLTDVTGVVFHSGAFSGDYSAGEPQLLPQYQLIYDKLVKKGIKVTLDAFSS
jgi:Protein of unknown function (DUF3626)